MNINDHQDIDMPEVEIPKGSKDWFRKSLSDQAKRTRQIEIERRKLMMKALYRLLDSTKKRPDREQVYLIQCYEELNSIYNADFEDNFNENHGVENGKVL